jgi:hypothetical protein
LIEKLDGTSLPHSNFSSDPKLPNVQEIGRRPRPANGRILPFSESWGRAAAMRAVAHFIFVTIRRLRWRPSSLAKVSVMDLSTSRQKRVLE